MSQSVTATYQQISSQFVSLVEKTIQRSFNIEELSHQTGQRGAHCEDVVNILKQILHHLFTESHQINFRMLGVTEESCQKLRAVLNTQARKVVHHRTEGCKSKEEPVGQFYHTKSVSLIWSSHVTQSQIYSEDCYLNGLSLV